VNMATFFGKPEVQYKPPGVDGDIPVAEFLHSCNGIVEFVTFMGTAFLPVKNDIQGNVLKISRVYETDPTKYATIKKLLDSEAKENSSKMGVATDALLWLKRGLEFICYFLESFVADHRSGHPSETLVGAGQMAYEKTLKQHHNMLQRGLFAMIIHATPWRKDFLKTMALGRSDAEEECISDLERYLPPTRANVNALMDIYHQRGFEIYNSITANSQ